MKAPIITRLVPDVTKITQMIVRIPDFMKGVTLSVAKANRFVVPELFSGHGADINWIFYAKTATQKVDFLKATVSTKLGGLGTQRHTAHLRWMMSASIGMPTAPFKVWRRFTNAGEGKALAPLKRTTVVGEIINIEFGEPLAKLFLIVRAGPQGAVFSALRGAPIFEGAEFPVFIKPDETAVVTISSPAMAGVSLAGVAEVIGASGITVDDYVALEGWQLIETVGLPANPPADPALAGWQGKQGLGPDADEPPVDTPGDAAMLRLSRGAPPFGWPDRIDPGTSAPVWAAPDSKALLQSLLTPDGLVANLFVAMKLPMTEQHLHSVPVAIDAVTAGPVTLPPGSAGLPTLGLAQLAASTDPFLALALGFGTAVPALADEKPAKLEGVTANIAGVRAQTSTDFLVTAEWGPPDDRFELAAPIPQPPPGLVPFAPTNLAATPKPPDRPPVPDAPWNVTVALEWDRVPRNSLYTVASAAGARAGESGCQPLLDMRIGGGWQTIAATAGTDKNGNPLPRFGLRDPGVGLSAASSVQRWGVTQQTVFGLWSPWAAAAATLVAPEPQVPVIASLRLDAVPGTSFELPCPATVEFELLYDWAVRTPASINLRARMYTAATRSAPLPNASLPPGFQRGTGIGGAEIAIVFVGDIPGISGAPGATIEAIDPDSGGVLSGPPGPVRRYRIRIAGLSADFGLGFAGIGVWAAATEHAEPKRASAWTKPRSTGASDPRPPVPAVLPVPKIGSLPDAQGRSHVGLSWIGTSPGAHYTVYEADEMSLLAKSGLPEPDLDASLVARLQTLNGLDFAAMRKVFARRDGPPIQDDRADIAMPRGSNVFHAFVVLGTSAGGIEGAWPATKQGVNIVFPARAVAPSPPWLEAHLKNGAVEVIVTPQPGVPASKIELFRTRLPQAATDVALMGAPAITVPVATSGPVIIIDDPAPSWRPWWYRAVCRSADDFDRARFGARGPASSGFRLLVPPVTPPPLSNIVVTKGGAGQLALYFTSALPGAATPLGAHAVAIDNGGTPGARFTLDAVPPAVLRRGADWRWVFPRPIAPAFDLIVRITDPLGRVTEEMVPVPATVLAQPVLFGARAQANASRTLLTFLSPPEAFTAAAAQTVILQVPALGLVLPPVALKSLTATAKLIAPGVKIARSGTVDGMTGVSVTLPSTEGFIRVTIAGGGETAVREVPVKW